MNESLGYQPVPPRWQKGRVSQQNKGSADTGSSLSVRFRQSGPEEPEGEHVSSAEVNKDKADYQAVERAMMRVRSIMTQIAKVLEVGSAYSNSKSGSVLIIDRDVAQQIRELGEGNELRGAEALKFKTIADMRQRLVQVTRNGLTGHEKMKLDDFGFELDELEENQQKAA